jgi:demethoxyubiquinone hydroxylase (CLK1/Coq7/Cat5 family)
MTPAIHDDELWVLSYYRASELAGALLFGRLARRTRDAELACQLTKHCAEEARHAWLWTETICRLGCLPVLMEETYQSRYARQIGLPISMPELLALTHVFEARIQQHFTVHARRADVHPLVRETLQQLLDEEVSHLSWIAKRLAKYRQEEGVDVPTLLLRYRKADEAIYADVMRFETRLWTYLGLEREGVVSDAER